jgi:hypothetical protein
VVNKNYDLEYDQERRNKPKEYLKKIKVAIAIFLAGDFRKISLRNFEREMRKIFTIFPNDSDQKSEKNVI